jgi:transcription-repair coupling factor (superfamily II helicase)
MAPAVTLDLPLRALIPEEYVAERALRLRLYRRIAGVTDTAAIDTLAEELVDRFGPMPVEVQNLLYQVRIKVLALAAGVSAIGRDTEQLVLRSDDSGNGRPPASASAHRRCRARRPAGRVDTADRRLAGGARTYAARHAGGAFVMLE